MCNECFGNGYVGRHIARATKDTTVSVSVSAPCPKCRVDEHKAWVEKRTKKEKKND